MYIYLNLVHIETTWIGVYNLARLQVHCAEKTTVFTPFPENRDSSTGVAEVLRILI